MKENTVRDTNSPRPRNKRLIASDEPPRHSAVGNVFLQSCKIKMFFLLQNREASKTSKLKFQKSRQAILVLVYFELSATQQASSVLG